MRPRWEGAPESLRRFARSERLRGAGRLQRLPRGSRLRDYEACYFRARCSSGATMRRRLGTGARASRSEAFPAAVRAARIAVATRLGREGLGWELARAARATLLGVETHILGNHLLENGFGLACAGSAATGAEAGAWWAAGRGDNRLAARRAVPLRRRPLRAVGLVSPRPMRGPARDDRPRWRRRPTCPGRLDDRGGEGGRLGAGRQGARRNVSAVQRRRTRRCSFDRRGDRSRRSLGIRPSAAAPRTFSGVSVVHLDATGWLLLAAPGGTWMAVDAGPDADGWQPGHAHADGLTFELWVSGRRSIVDFRRRVVCGGRCSHRDAGHAFPQHGRGRWPRFVRGVGRVPRGAPRPRSGSIRVPLRGRRRRGA